MKKIVEEFRNFIMRGNVLDLAIGVIIGGGFSTIVNSLVKDILMPPIGVLLGNVDFADLYVQLNPGKVMLASGMKLVAAQEAGAVTWNYGLFINSVISFLIIAISVFAVVKMINKLHKPKPAAPAEIVDKDCPYCLTKIPLKATRCPNCTSELKE